MNQMEELCHNNKIVIIICIENYDIVDQVENFIAHSNLNPHLIGSMFAVEAAIFVGICYEKIPEMTAKILQANQKCKDFENERMYQIHKGIFHNALEHLQERTPLLVYQGEKVGSCSVFQGIRRTGISAAHIHFMNPSKNHNHMGMDTGLNIRDYISNIENVRIVTGVREPIARSLSLYAYSIYCDMILPSKNIYEDACNFVKRDMSDEIFDSWFEYELKENFGVDVYEYPFDKEKGYSVIQKNNISVFVYKMECLSKAERALGDFIGNCNFRLQYENAGDQIKTKYIYRQLKENLKMPDDIIQYYYENKRVRHFYTDQEMEEMRIRWSSAGRM